MKAPAEHASSSRASGVSVDMVVPVRLRPIGAAFVLVGVVDGGGGGRRRRRIEFNVVGSDVMDGQGFGGMLLADVYSRLLTRDYHTTSRHAMINSCDINSGNIHFPHHDASPIHRSTHIHPVEPRLCSIGRSHGAIGQNFGEYRLINLSEFVEENHAGPRHLRGRFQCH